MFKVLIIGCGNIGALYDLKNKNILTHAKAFSKIQEFSLYFFDINFNLAKRVAKKYNGNYLEKINEKDFKNFNCICISTPTSTHFKFLKYAFNSNIPFVICEKPISNNEKDLRQLLKLYKKNDTKVLVNYIRRFQVSYIRLRKYIINQLKKDDIKKIVIKYQRGFLNNCSHSLDLIQFLTDSDIVLKKNMILSRNNKFSHKDPTISFFGKWNNTEIFILGFEDTSFKIFEIDIFFNNTKIEIKESGNVIDIFTIKSSSKFKTNNLVKDVNKSVNGCMKNYMTSIAEIVKSDLQKNNFNDNFVESLNLNLKMLKIIKKC